MSLPQLYKLADQYHHLALLGEDDDLPPEVIRDTLEGLTGELELKATNVAKFVLGLEAEADAMDAAADAIKERGARRRRRAESIRNYILLCMQSAGMTKISCPEFTLSVRKNPEAVEIEDVTKIPSEFMVTPEPPPPRPDKSLIKAALKAGTRVVGAWLRQGERLDIRI